MNQTVQQTTNYDMFKFRDDNRQKISEKHINALIASIKSRNLLEMRPIMVNAEMEVIDGQHRLMAAKSLGVPIYYKIEKSLGITDLLLMNTAKAWSAEDYLNYFCKNGFDEYLKLKKFIDENKLTISTAIRLLVGGRHDQVNKFRIGLFKMRPIDDFPDLSIIHETIETIRKFNGLSPYVTTTKFWGAMVKLLNHPNFNLEKWRTNLSKLVDRCRTRVSVGDYFQMLAEIHNWSNKNKIQLITEEPE